MNIQSRSAAVDTAACEPQPEATARLLDTAFPPRLPASRPALRTFSGALAQVKPPEYDGPVRWSSVSTDRFASAAIGGFAGAFGGGPLAAMLHLQSATGFFAAVGCCAVLGGWALAKLCKPSVERISFNTTVLDVLAASPAHYERHGRISGGPYFRQTLAIPECPLPLSASFAAAPCIPGQKIVAEFFVDRLTGEIVSWIARAGRRDGSTQTR